MWIEFQRQTDGIVFILPKKQNRFTSKPFYTGRMGLWIQRRPSPQTLNYIHF